MRILIALLLLIIAPVSALAQTPVRLAVFLVDFSTSTPPPYDAVGLSITDAAKVDAYFAEQSYGQFVTQSDVFGIYRLALDRTATLLEVATATQAAATGDGVDLAAYGHQGGSNPACRCVYVTPIIDGWGGIAQSVGYAVFIVGIDDQVRPLRWEIGAHELGHLLEGWDHDHALVCDDGPFQGICQSWEYGDSLSIMGHGYGHVSPLKKEQAGWLTLPTVTTSGEYWLTPYEATEGVRALRVIGGTKQTPRTFTLEYRQPLGFDRALIYPDDDNVFHGIVIHWQDWQGQASYLLRMNPSTVHPSVIERPALEVGQTWCQGGKLAISVLSADVTGARVRIDYGRCR